MNAMMMCMVVMMMMKCRTMGVRLDRLRVVGGDVERRNEALSLWMKGRVRVRSGACGETRLIAGCSGSIWRLDAAAIWAR